jgi:hypothetical protein
MARSERRKRTTGGLAGALVLATLATLSSPNVSVAQSNDFNSRRLTDRGRWLIAGSVNGAWAYGGAHGFGSPKHWFVQGSPQVSYFVRDRIGVGLSVQGGIGDGIWGSYRARSSSLGAGISGAFELPLSGRLGLLLRPFLGYHQQWRSLSARRAAPGLVKQQQLGALRLELGMELLVHLTEHVALAAGPDIFFDVLLNADGRQAVSPDDNGFGPGPYALKSKPYRVQVGLGLTLLFGI